MRHVVLTLITIVTAAGCATVGPDYRRPDVETPGAFRGDSPAAVPPAAGATGGASIADALWPDVFVDATLRELIGAAVTQNFDVRLAANRVVQARALLGITRSNEFPTVNAQGVGQGQRSSIGTGDGEARTGGVAQLGVGFEWDLDFWGKYRRATESARAQLLATEWAHRAVVAALVGDVASGYFALRALDFELEIATRTLATREESLRITRIRESGGATSLVDVRQAEQLVFGARGAIVDLQRQIGQQENFLSLLLGRDPGPIARGQALTEQPHVAEVPAGLPSTLLERRPDIQQAEQLLVSANAEIGVARAALFPQVALTGSGGVASSALSALFSGPAAAWTAAASVVQPIFNASRLRSDIALTEARHQEAVLAYQQTIQRSFREASDALIDYHRTQELRATQELLVASAQDARRLADLRYQGGATGYLEVLDSDTRLFDAERALARARRNELAAYVEIYRALGGGWRQ